MKLASERLKKINVWGKGLNFFFAPTLTLIDPLTYRYTGILMPDTFEKNLDNKVIY